METVGDFFSFRRMVTPIVVQIVFWIGIVLIVIGGIGAAVTADNIATAIGAIAMVILGPIVLRIYAEIVIVLFRINESLADINHNTSKA